MAKLVAESKAPNVDIQIFFDFDSAEILPQARPSLDELGKALSDPRLAGGTFPHRRAHRRQGQRRLQASAVATARGFGQSLPDPDLPRRWWAPSAIGFGEEQLKNKDDPFADENRRVQIVNAGGANVAEGKSAPAPHSEALPQ